MPQDNPVSPIKILEISAANNAYLHKDFHGALCYAIQYLDEKYGHATTKAYLEQVAKHCFSTLISALRDKGLVALEDHFRRIFTQENGQFTIEYRDETLMLTVDQCPAVQHMLSRNQFFTPRYCETSVVVNDTICREAGFCASCHYEPGAGRCVQKFWKETIVKEPKS